ncbi:hypothetical protein JKP88DRAFT_351037 [Tribonema minus]|uniref:Uncharacterized protein n=1 Tax=Tribonema minus TaxID=303371 RepID=A0A835YK24_9STRA|nr:hypothetical protein JKP88DRAFT_351037 [Tribonema minus]
MRKTLTDSLHYTEEEVNDMEPQIAAIVIEKGLPRPRAGMPIAWRKSFRRRESASRGPSSRALAAIRGVAAGPVAVFSSTAAVLRRVALPVAAVAVVAYGVTYAAPLLLPAWQRAMDLFARDRPHATNERSSSSSTGGGSGSSSYWGGETDLGDGRAARGGGRKERHSNDPEHKGKSNVRDADELMAYDDDAAFEGLLQHQEKHGAAASSTLLDDEFPADLEQLEELEQEWAAAASKASFRGGSGAGKALADLEDHFQLGTRGNKQQQTAGKQEHSLFWWGGSGKKQQEEGDSPLQPWEEPVQEQAKGKGKRGGRKGKKGEAKQDERQGGESWLDRKLSSALGLGGGAGSSSSGARGGGRQ